MCPNSQHLQLKWEIYLDNSFRRFQPCLVDVIVNYCVNLNTESQLIVWVYWHGLTKMEDPPRVSGPNQQACNLNGVRRGKKREGCLLLLRWSSNLHFHLRCSSPDFKHKLQPSNKTLQSSSVDYLSFQNILQTPDTGCHETIVSQDAKRRMVVGGTRSQLQNPWRHVQQCACLIPWEAHKSIEMTIKESHPTPCLLDIKQIVLNHR